MDEREVCKGSEEGGQCKELTYFKHYLLSGHWLASQGFSGKHDSAVCQVDKCWHLVN